MMDSDLEAEPSYELATFERTLIMGAIQLGDWIKVHRDCTADQRRAVVRLQHFLRNLPSPDMGLNAEYGVVIEPDVEGAPESVYRSWQVSVTGGFIEVYSMNASFGGNRDEEWEYELDWHASPGTRPPFPAHYVKEWIAEVVHLAEYVRPAHHANLEASEW